jgi:general secretion pathway protein D
MDAVSVSVDRRMSWAPLHPVILGVLLSVWVGTAVGEPPVGPPGRPSATNERVVAMNFPEVDIRVLIKFISEVTGRNFVLDDRVRGNVTIIAPQEMSVDDAYAAFQTALHVAGFTTVPSGAVIKIVPVQEAKSSAIETVVAQNISAPSNRIITELFSLKNADAGAMVPIVRELVSPNGVVAAYTPTNTLLIVDNAANVDRLRGILDALDVREPREQVSVLRLMNRPVTEIAPTLQDVLGQ